jgi:hypothetical protein
MYKLWPDSPEEDEWASVDGESDNTENLEESEASSEHSESD